MLIYLEKRPFVIGKFNYVISFLFKSFKKSLDSKIILPCSLNDLAVQNEKKNRFFYKDVNYCTSDSMIITKYLCYKYKKQIDRIYGPDLMLAILEKSKKEKSKLNHYFLAPDKKTMKALSSFCKIKYRELKLNFYFLKNNITEEEETAYLKKMLLKKIDIIWIGIGSPKQIKIASWIKNNSTGISIFCVGAAFEFISGRKKQAPQWIRKSGFEWLFRLLSEPKRLWRRYIITIPKYLIWRNL